MEKNNSKKPYRQLFADEHNETFQMLLRDPLLLAIFTLCSIRARRIVKASPEGLNQFEFWLSEMEFERFGLKSSQKGMVRRRLLSLLNLKLILKVEKTTGNKNSNVYAFNSNEVIFINPETENILENDQRGNSEQTDTNNNVNNVKNDKKYINTENLTVIEQFNKKTGTKSKVFGTIDASSDSIVSNEIQNSNEWQNHAFRVSNRLGLKTPSTLFLKLFKNAYKNNQQGYLDSTVSFCADATDVRDMEKLFCWEFNQLIKERLKKVKNE